MKPPLIKPLTCCRALPALSARSHLRTPTIRTRNPSRWWKIATLSRQHGRDRRPGEINQHNTRGFKQKSESFAPKSPIFTPNFSSPNSLHARSSCRNGAERRKRKWRAHVASTSLPLSIPDWRAGNAGKASPEVARSPNRWILPQKRRILSPKFTFLGENWTF